MSVKIIAILFVWFVFIFANISGSPTIRNMPDSRVENFDATDILSNKMMINVPTPQKLKHECPKNYVWIKNSCRFRVG